MTVSLKPAKLVVLDLDDTLCLEWDFLIGGFHAVAEHLAGKLNRPADQIYQQLLDLHNAGRRDKFQAVLDKLDSDAEIAQIDELVEIYRTADRPLKLEDDADRFLTRLRFAEVKTAILTDGPLEGQKTKVRLLGLKDRVGTVLYTSEREEGFQKPGTKGFELLAGLLGTPHETCVYIADNEKKDFPGPNKLGWQTVKIKRDRALYASFENEDPLYRPDHTIVTLDDLILSS